MASVVRLADFRPRQRPVFFNRPELNQLLSLYSRRVSRGEWRDYAIDHSATAAVFSVFRHSDSRPLFTIAKFAPGTRRRGDYVLTAGGRRLKEGRTLGDVLAAVPAPSLMIVSYVV
ncbi:MAG: DUF2794 domain-containing protein [Alphaproteobacteria bacterium]